MRFMVLVWLYGSYGIWIPPGFLTRSFFVSVVLLGLDQILSRWNQRPTLFTLYPPLSLSLLPLPRRRGF